MASIPDPLLRAPAWPAFPPAAGSIRHVLLPAGTLPEPAAGETLLGLTAFGTTLPAGLAPALPHAVVPLPGLGNGPVLEAWYAASAVEYGESEGIRYARTPVLLFGVARTPAHNIAAATRALYLRIIRLVRAEAYPALVRMWNYFPQINADDGDLERYRRFCVGRHQAFAETGYTFGEDLPAASAIGSAEGELHVSFIAARRPPVQIENPRQISAYRYPPSYGPRSPSFSRAMVLTTGKDRNLFISGTASILGHLTLHAGDSLRQCQTTVENLRTILEQAGLGDSAALGQQAAWKVYLRRPQDIGPVRTLLQDALAPDSPMMFLAGDICRKDLLLEIEGWVNCRHPCPGTNT